MTRTLHLLRHAKSSWADQALDDFDRPLNARGRAAALSLASYLRDVPIELVICSPALRTRQTLAPITVAIGPELAVVFAAELYETSAEYYLQVLQDRGEGAAHVLMVGHEPSISQLCQSLAGSASADAVDRLRVKYPTGTLATLSWDGTLWRDLSHGAAHLQSVIRPRDLLQQEE